MAVITKQFDEVELARRVDVLARAITETMGEDFMIVGVLKGCFVFIADLIRSLDRLGPSPRVEFIRLCSYGQSRESSGQVRLIGEVATDIAERRILLVDDIVDTGRTLEYARNLLIEKGAARIWTCALIDKPIRREIDCEVDFVGFTVDDVFVVGYGIDLAEEYRHLPYIGFID